ncbi:MAG: hypothetical protein C4288_21305 [Leptolyngbya sp. ERB_1_1]
MTQDQPSRLDRIEARIEENDRRYEERFDREMQLLADLRTRQESQSQQIAQLREAQETQSQAVNNLRETVRETTTIVSQQISGLVEVQQ